MIGLGLSLVSIAVRQLLGGAFTPAILFGTSDQGVWYDPSDFTTLFTDSAGITPVTALEQPVGLMLDKSGKGNHAAQPTATSRPVVSARVNQLERTEDFANAYWTKDAVTTPSANELLETTTTALHGVRRFNVATLATGVNYVLSVKVKANGRNFVLLYTNQGNSGKYFDITPGTSGAVLGNYSGTSVFGAIQALGNDDFLCSITVPSAGTALGAEIYISDTGTRVSYTGDGTSGIYIWGADIRPSNDGVGIPPYQRVNTATDYDSVGFPVYLRADGVDDGMVTNSIDFTATDKMTVVAGVRKLSDAARGLIFETGNGTTLTGVFILDNLGSPGFSYRMQLAGSTYLSRYTTTPTAPNTDVLQYSMNIDGATADQELSAQYHGVAQTLTTQSGTTNAGTGNFGNYPLDLFRRGGTTLPFNGRFYGLTIVNKLLSTTELTQLETYTNGKTKAFA